MARTTGYTEEGKETVHLYTECPEGRKIAHRSPAPASREALKLCSWCSEKDAINDTSAQDET